MINLTEHFTLEEVEFSSIAVRFGIANKVPPELMANVQAQAAGMEGVRMALGWPIHIDSWYRCEALNIASKGAKASAHMLGWATDFICAKFGTPLEICRKIIAAKIRFDQLIFEGNWVHCSFFPELRCRVLTAHFNDRGEVFYTSGLPLAPAPAQ